MIECKYVQKISNFKAKKHVDRLVRGSRVEDKLLHVVSFLPFFRHEAFLPEVKRVVDCMPTQQGSWYIEYLGLYVQSNWPFQDPMKAWTKATIWTHYNTIE